MKTTPVKGTQDYLPKEAAIRSFLEETILRVYRENGFLRIITPALEDAENLDKSEGGDNLNLIFKILKRGDKLKKALEDKNEADLSDLGLRYDLTLPLCRFIAGKRNEFAFPMKIIQVGNAYRAERPQKGRMREFIQCDIDVLGSTSPNIETEILKVAAEALINIGIKDFTFKLNDRRILKSWLLGLGFKEEDLDSVSISFDKLDKIELSGVVEEFRNKGFEENAVNNFKNSMERRKLTLEEVEKYVKDEEVLKNFKTILSQSTLLSEENNRKNPHMKYFVEYEPSLVRGQGYYTGTIFEIHSNEFKGSIGGGGRYDNLVGKFIKEDIPAVGISLGFERIFSILMDQNYQIPNARKKIALFYTGDYVEADRKAGELRQSYDVSILEKPKKLSPYLDKLKSLGFNGFINIENSMDITELK